MNVELGVSGQEVLAKWSLVLLALVRVGCLYAFALEHEGQKSTLAPMETPKYRTQSNLTRVLLVQIEEIEETSAIQLCTVLVTLVQSPKESFMPLLQQYPQ